MKSLIFSVAGVAMALTTLVAQDERPKGTSEVLVAKITYAELDGCGQELNKTEVSSYMPPDGPTVALITTPSNHRVRVQVAEKPSTPDQHVIDLHVVEIGTKGAETVVMSPRLTVLKGYPGNFESGGVEGQKGCRFSVIVTSSKASTQK